MKSPHDHVCPWWLAWTFDNPFRKLIHRPERIFAPFLKPGMQVADVGCGMGYFTRGMGRLVGPGGVVHAVDLQPKMLALAKRRIDRAGLGDRTRYHLAQSTRVGLNETVDFVLLFWVAHEVARPAAFFAEIFALLNPGGRALVVEPRFHVSQAQLDESGAVARAAGFHAEPGPRVALSRTVVLTRPLQGAARRWLDQGQPGNQRPEREGSHAGHRRPPRRGSAGGAR